MSEATSPAILNLFTVRESVTDDELMLGKIQQTLTPYARADSSVREVLNLGLMPLKSPEKHGAIASRASGTITSILVRGHNAFLYHQGSAAKRNNTKSKIGKLDNIFTSMLIKCIETYKPSTVIFADFSRLVRSANYSSQILETLEEHVDLLIADGQKISPKTREGRLTFGMLATIADHDRSGISDRMSMGIISRAARGDYPCSPASLPFGYRKVGGRAEPDPDLRAVVKEAIRILGISNLTVRERAQMLADAGMRRTAASDRGPAGAAQFVKNASSSVQFCYRNLDAYSTGQRMSKYESPIYGADRILEFGVVTDNEARKSSVILPYQIGLPGPLDDGATDSSRGWATEAEFSRAFAERAKRRPKGGASHGKMYLLSDLPPWRCDSEWRWVQNSGQRVLLHHEQIIEGQEQGPDRDVHRLLAAVDRPMLLRSMAAAIQLALSNGVATRIALGMEGFRDIRRLSAVADRAARLSRLEEELRQARQLATRATSNLLETDEDTLQGALRERAEMAHREAKRLEEELKVELAKTPEVDIADGVQTDLDLLILALVLFEEVSTKVDRSVAAAVREVIRDFQLTPLGNGYCEWSCNLVVPAEGEALVLGPVTGTVPDTSASSGIDALRRRSGRPSRKAEMVMTEFLTSDRDLVDLIKAVSASPAHVLRRQVRHAAREAGLGDLGSRAITLGSPPPELRHAIWRIANDPSAAEESDWMMLIHRVYFESDTRWNQYWEVPTSLQRLFVNELARVGGQMTQADAVAIFGRPSRRRINDYTNPARPEMQVAERVSPDPGAPIQLLKCPHCGDRLTYVRRLPETVVGAATPRIMLCTSCRRHPSDGGPQFPGFYFLRT